MANQPDVMLGLYELLSPKQQTRLEATALGMVAKSLPPKRREILLQYMREQAQLSQAEASREPGC